MIQRVFCKIVFCKNKKYVCLTEDKMLNIPFQNFFNIIGRDYRDARKVTTFFFSLQVHCTEGHAVAQLVEALRYKSEGRWFEFFIDLILPPHNGPGVDTVSNRNEYQVYFLGVKTAGA
jgi:hypothetical protein